ncbi:MAG: hypothetical protein ACREVW_07400 [Burkholderiales bacterium]
MDLGLKSKTALVLDAGGGLDSAIAVVLAREGAAIAVADVEEAAIARTVLRQSVVRGDAKGYALRRALLMEFR